MGDAAPDVAQLAATLKRGSFVAAAGCGKTEEISKATKIAEGRRLVLTHTHAGVDAIRERLKKRKVEPGKYRVETIAGWCLRYAVAFPQRSRITSTEPKNTADWKDIYEAATRLLGSGAVAGVLPQSYRGVLVDEYQDCSTLQHTVIKGLAEHLPVCVFGDPLQSIFDFEQGQKAVDWPLDVFPVFEKAGELTTPWRWRNADNQPLAKWLEAVRTRLETGHEIDLRDRPVCVKWKQLPADKGVAKGITIGACKQAIGTAGQGDSVVVIADPVNLSARADLAKSLAAVGFSNIEPLTCAVFYKTAKEFEKKTGFARLDVAMDFVERCMTGCSKTAFLNAVKSRQSGKKAGAKEFGELIGLGVAVAEGGGIDAVLALIDGFREREVTRSYRREMFFAMRSALKIKMARPALNLEDAIWEVQNRIRHAGRLVSQRSVGSTLLVKGLEFDHSIVVHAARMNRNDWYVALTRATKGMTILAPTERFTAPA